VYFRLFVLVLVIVIDFWSDVSSYRSIMITSAIRGLSTSKTR
jgi:hypothetical protein